MDLILNSRQSVDVTIIDAAGRITRGEAVDLLRRTIAEVISAEHRKVLLNLKEVESIDSEGIGVLVAAVTQVRCASCEAVYSGLLRNDCPSCGAGVENSEVEVNAVDGVWTPVWGEFKLLHPNRRIEDLLRITKLHEAFRVYHDEAVAVHSFS